MSISDIIEGKKEWRAHVARVKALPQDYRIVYKELQKYLFKVGPAELSEGTELLTGIVELFEEGAAMKKNVLEITGSDVAAFCDALIGDSATFESSWQENVDRTVSEAVKKSMGKKSK